jgi:hypothetical protein
MRITLADGMHYCYDCGELILDDIHESVWYCLKDAKRRGWNIIDGKRVKVPKNENEINRAVNETNSTTNTGESISEKTK